MHFNPKTDTVIADKLSSTGMVLFSIISLVGSLDWQDLSLTLANLCYLLSGLCRGWNVLWIQISEILLSFTRTVKTQTPSLLCHTRNDVCLPGLRSQKTLLVPWWGHACFIWSDQNKHRAVHNMCVPFVQMNLMSYRIYFLKIQNLVEYNEQFRVPCNHSTIHNLESGHGC